MESQNNQTSLRPSKHFLIRGGIATVLLIMILIVQTNWFSNLFNKKPKISEVVSPESTTLAGLLGKDTNGNGIADWEEKLWGLDPAVLYTNGISNKEIIEQKKKSLGITDSDNEPENETDLLAKQLFTITTALSQSDQSDTTLQAIGADLGKNINLKQVTNHYNQKNLITTKTSTTTLTTYYNSMSKIVANYKDETSGIETVITALETGDSSRISEIRDTGNSYIDLSKQLQKVSVPVGVADYHLALMNGFYAMGESFDYLIQMDENGIYGVVGIGIYREYALRVDQALSDLRDYFIQYGILNE